MPANATAYSPKEWSVWVKKEATAGTTVLATTGMYQLDVDSVGFPSLNPTQVLDVRTGAGRTFKADDFFQDNVMRTVEMSVSGTLHNDAGHKLLLQNICDSFADPVIVATAWTPPTITYGVANTTDSEETMTLVVKAPDHSSAQSMVLNGCVVTSFNYTSDAGTEGGRLKFNATLQTGIQPTLDEATTLAGNNLFANSTDMFLSSASAKKINNIDVLMQSFGVTIENPAVFAGISSTGYEIVGRGSEISVTAESVIKYDSTTDGLINTFDAQTTSMATNAFAVTSSGNWGATIDNGVFTDVSLNEGDFMQLNVAIKAVDDSATLLSIDV